jgi:hypothetical protein
MGPALPPRGRLPRLAGREHLPQGPVEHLAGFRPVRAKLPGRLHEPLVLLGVVRDDFALPPLAILGSCGPVFVRGLRVRFGNDPSILGGAVANDGPAQETGRLRFNGHNDALDFARKSVEESRRWLAARGLTVAERYKQGQLYLALAIKPTSRLYPNHIKLLLRAVPPQNSDVGRSLEKTETCLCAEKEVGKIDVQLENNLVFIRARQPTHGVKEVVPSTVWLESLEERYEIGRDVPTVTSDNFINAPRIASKRKVVVPFLAPKLKCGSIDNLVQRMPEIVEGIGCSNPQSPRRFMGDPNLDQLITGLTVYLGEWHASALLSEDVAFSFKLVDVFPSPCEE